MSGPHATVGFYGKLPCVGDFVRRRLPDAFVAPWDAAMQRLLLSASGDDAPVRDDASRWRFALAPGVCGDRAWIGCVRASRDRVGRAFPLVLAAPLAAAAPAWFDAAERLHAQALRGEFADVEAFDRACARLRADAADDPRLAAWRRAHAGDDGRRCSLWWRADAPARRGAWITSVGLAFAEGGRELDLAYAPLPAQRTDLVEADA